MHWWDLYVLTIGKCKAVLILCFLWFLLKISDWITNLCWLMTTLQEWKIMKLYLTFILLQFTHRGLNLHIASYQRNDSDWYVYAFSSFIWCDWCILFSINEVKKMSISIIRVSNVVIFSGSIKSLGHGFLWKYVDYNMRKST